MAARRLMSGRSRSNSFYLLRMGKQNQLKSIRTINGKMIHRLKKRKNSSFRQSQRAMTTSLISAKPKWSFSNKDLVRF